jgi:hypothetical protein
MCVGIFPYYSEDYQHSRSALWQAQKIPNWVTLRSPGCARIRFDVTGKPMLSDRTSVVAAGAMVLVLAGVTGGGALAETGIRETSSHRVLLLQIIEQRTQSYRPVAKAVKRHHLARRWSGRLTRIAEKRHSELTKISRTGAGEEAGRAGDAAPSPIEVESLPGEPAVDVRPIQVASPPGIDGVDVTRSDALLEPNSGAAIRLAESFTLIHDAAGTVEESELAKIAVEHQPRGIGEAAPATLKMLATLSGAATAGSFALFLISSARRLRFRDADSRA